MSKKLLVIIFLMFLVVFAGAAFASDAATANTAVGGGYLDDFYKGAVALVLTALAALITVLVPIVAKKGNQTSDAFFAYLKTQTKKIENERIGRRVDQFLDILDSTVDSLFTVAGKVVVEKTPEGKIVVKNLDELMKEAHNNALPKLTNSTKDLTKDIGLEAKDVIESMIKERACKLI